MKGHSHADPDRSALSADGGMRAIKISTFGLLATAAIQMVVVLIGGSAALLADSLHNFGDVFTTVGLWIAFTASRRAADERYTYGYDRFEDLMGVVIVLIIGATAAVSGWESYNALAHPRKLTAIGASIGAGVIGFLGNSLVAEYKLRAGRKINSVALEADGHHSRTDALVSLGAVAGLTAVALGFPSGDGIAGLLITLAIVWVTIVSARDVVARLADKVDPQIIERIGETAKSVERVLDVHSVQARWAGRSLFVQLNISLDESTRLDSAHETAEQVRHQVIHYIPGVAQVLVHVDPSHPEKTHDAYHAGTSHHDSGSET